MAATDHLEDFDEVLIIWQWVKKLNWSNTYYLNQGVSICFEITKVILLGDMALSPQHFYVLNNKIKKISFLSKAKTLIVSSIPTEIRRGVKE